MKWGIFIITAVLLMGAVSAADISFSINGISDQTPVPINPGEDVTVEIIQAPFTYIYNVQVETDNELLRQVIETTLDEFERTDRSLIESATTETRPAPPFLPGGTHEITLTFQYSDAQFQEKTLSQTIILDIPQGSSREKLLNWLLSILPDDVASELIDRLLGRNLEPLPRDLTLEELLQFARQEGLDINVDYQIKKVASSNTTQELDKEDIEQLEKNTDNTDLQKELKKIKRRTPPTITKDLNVFEITTKNGTYNVSKIVVGIGSGKKSLNRLSIIEVIPKEIAENANLLTFSELPDVIEIDPIVKWNFDHVPAEDQKEYSYTVQGEVEEVNSTTYSGGKEPSAFAEAILNVIDKVVAKEETKE
ncbi:MAG: hypothetical protein KC535_05845 [Nanoarchaeota archaeon]|nr:hypothetical protein [Nanoarchaeota archaeon]